MLGSLCPRCRKRIRTSTSQVAGFYRCPHCQERVWIDGGKVTVTPGSPSQDGESPDLSSLVTKIMAGLLVFAVSFALIMSAVEWLKPSPASDIIGKVQRDPSEKPVDYENIRKYMGMSKARLLKELGPPSQVENSFLIYNKDGIYVTVFGIFDGKVNYVDARPKEQ